ncbi:MAG: lysylphosphatidylglycerol synthase transmembrane domain-containing protein [Granulosicoccus sp.]
MVINLTKAFVAIAVLCLLFAFVDVKQSFTLLWEVQPLWTIAAILMVQVQIILSAQRWRLTAKRLGLQIGILRSICEYYLGTLANMVLPGGVVGDASRIYRNRQPDGLAVSAHAVVLERTAGQIALFFITLAGCVLWPVFMRSSFPQFGLWLLIVTLSLLALVGLCIYLLVRFAPKALSRFLVDFGPSIQIAWLADRQWIRQAVLSIGIVFTYLLIFFFSALAVGEPLSVVATLTVVPLVLLSMVVPVSVGGWGIREAAAASLWPIVGLSSEAGVATSIVYALVTIIGCLPCIGCLLVRRICSSIKQV